MHPAFKSLRLPLLPRFSAMLMATVLLPLGCRGQAASGATGSRLSPELTRRIEVLIRSRSNVPPNYVIRIGERSKSEVPGFSEVAVFFSADGKDSKPVSFLVSDDGKTVAQFSKYDISEDPKRVISGAGRPGRGGPETAPVTIVGFDDLECPFCGKLHEQIFPALLERYKDQVRFVYKDFPLPMHPWATRAAIDSNCLGAQSTTGYWNVVDHVHLHAGELGGAEKSLAVANTALDTIVREEGKRQKVDEARLNACLQKQDDAAVQRSIKEGEALGVDSTPALFINGEKFQGAYPVADLFRMIDEALIAQGKTPPPAPPVKAPASRPAE